ncbi:hypothetical protein BRAO375_2100019 [Bradyrhizobium sp. ORS 375]|nr:hypothetical protein BRAO375_2100019 [Bradyrhizobium sp. ORS 375]
MRNARDGAYAANSVTNAKLAQMVNRAIKCRTTADPGDPEDCTATRTRPSLVVGTTVQAREADPIPSRRCRPNRMIACSGAGTAAARTITAPAAGITISNGDGVAGNPTLALANDLAPSRASAAPASLDFSISTIGSCTNTIGFTLPNTPNAGAGLAGHEIAANGKTITCSILCGSTGGTCVKADASNFVAGDCFVISDVYEDQQR